MINTMLLAALDVVPSTSAWSPSIGLVMIVCNLVAVAIGYYGIKNPGVGPDLPAGKPAMFKNFGVAELLATASFGHILGAGVILGLSSSGAL